MGINLFDSNFYRAANPDLTQAGLTTDAQVLSHFQNTGLNEGRTFSALVNLNVYRASNPDLAQAGLTTNQQLYEHLQNTGVAEGRQFSEFADLNFYLATNPDVNTAFSGNREQAFGHLQAGGVAEGRLFSKFIDTNFYLATNPDVAQAYGGDRVLALQHLELTGLNENRAVSTFFDLNYYRLQNPDLVQAGLNGKQLLQHCAVSGLTEGRAFSKMFDLNYYKSYNLDVANAGFSNLQTYEHFQHVGLNEGRISSAAFNVRVYLANNPDLVVAGLNNRQAYDHFVLNAQREGRPGSDYAGNTLSTARNISIGATPSYYIFDFVTNALAPVPNSTDTDDYYRFQLTAVSNVGLNLDGLSADTNLQLIQDMNDNGVVDTGEVIVTAANSGVTPELIQINSLAAGSYYIRVYSSDEASTFTYYSLNTWPTIRTITGVTLDEGASVTLSNSQLQITDVESTASQLTYALDTTMTQGTLRLSGTALSGGQTFTQADINNGLVSYQHNGSETTSDSFSFTVSDGAGGSINSTNFNITVNPVNDAPVLDNSGTLTLATIGRNMGTLIPALIGSAITDVDNGAVPGIAVTGLDTSNGSWEFSTDNGSSWTVVGAVAANAALLLAADSATRLRFVVNNNFMGTVTIDFQAWDRTSGNNGGTANITETGTGSTTAFSLLSETVTVTVNNAPYLVKDIASGSSSSEPYWLTNVNGTLYFAAFDSVNGYELWKSDGTTAGTVLVKDINPGWSDSYPSNLTKFNGTLYFTANDGVNGTELWKSDGSTVGTVLVKDINPGSSSSYPDSLINVNGTLYFTATDDVNGRELWKSDGTTAGTVLVKDINPGSSRSFPMFNRNSLTNVNGTLYFAADDGVNGFELWKSDGTAAGTVLVKDIYPGSVVSDSYPGFLTNVNGVLYFTADDGVNGRELWRSDGTTAGTVLVKNINPGSGYSSPYALNNVNDTLYFVADDGVNGRELWKSDGTAVGTVLIKDINPGASDSEPFYYLNRTNVNGTLYFTADDGVNGRELWKSDGTVAGTVLVKDINPGASDSVSDYFDFPTNVNGVLYFAADDGVNGLELWKSDGTAAGTVLVQDIYSGSGSSYPYELTNVNGTLYFTATDGVNGTELWTFSPMTAPIDD